MKILKITAPEFRIWRANITQVVDAEGNPLREVTVEESRIFAELTKRARASRSSQIALAGGIEGAPDRKLEVVPTIHPNGVVTFKEMIDGNTTMSGRTLFKMELLKKHGSFQLRSFNGVVLCSGREQGAGTTTASSGVGGSPDSCPTCRDYAGRQPGRHHWVCQYNGQAPPDQQGSKDGVMTAAPGGSAPVAVAPNVRFMSGAPAPVPAPVALQQQSVPGFLMPADAKVIQTTGEAVAPPAPPPGPKSPETCTNQCTLWADYKKDGEHHHICQWRQPWIDARDGVEPKFLVDLDSEQVLRQASPEEILYANEHLGIVEIGDKTYGVIPKSEIPAVASTAASAAE